MWTNLSLSRRARLEHHHPHRGIGTQPVGQYRTGRAGAHDDVVGIHERESRRAAYEANSMWRAVRTPA